jgi:hypothetical protein
MAHIRITSPTSAAAFALVDLLEEYGATAGATTSGGWEVVVPLDGPERGRAGHLRLLVHLRDPRRTHASAARQSLHCSRPHALDLPPGSVPAGTQARVMNRDSFGGMCPKGIPGCCHP